MTLIYRRNPEFLWREETQISDDGESPAAILFNEGEILTLNCVAFDVWKICDGKTVDEISAQIEEMYDADPLEIRNDVESFLSDILSKGGVAVEQLAD